MIGPGLGVRGGVSSVERLIVNTGNDKGLSIDHLSSYEDGGILKKLLAFSRCVLLIPHRLLFSRYSLVHIHFSHYGSTLRKMIIFHLVRLFRIPVVLHSHGSDFHVFYRELPEPAKRFIRYSLSRSNQVIALSESWKDFFVDDLGLESTKVTVLQNPVELVADAVTHEIDRIQYLFLGRLEKRKGIYDIVDALARLRQLDRLAHCHVVAAGDGDVQEVRALIRDEGLEESVSIEGWVDRQRVVDLLAESHVLLLPSYNEGLPMALLEAMACGLTVITTPVGGIPEVVRDQENGLLIEPGNVKALADAMICSQDRGFRKNLGERAAKSMQHNSIDAYCDRLIATYAALTSTDTGVSR